MIDRSNPQLSLSAPMSCSRSEPRLALLSVQRREPGDAGVDAAHRRAVHGLSFLRQPPDGAAPRPRRYPRRQTSGQAADAQDGLAGDLSGTAHQPAAPRAQDLSISAQGLGDYHSQPGLVLGHHLHSDAARDSVPGRDHGLGLLQSPGMDAFEHDGRFVLRRGTRRRHASIRQASDLQHRSLRGLLTASLSGFG